MAVIDQIDLKKYNDISAQYGLLKDQLHLGKSFDDFKSAIQEGNLKKIDDNLRSLNQLRQNFMKSKNAEELTEAEKTAVNKIEDLTKTRASLTDLQNEVRDRSEKTEETSHNEEKTTQDHQNDDIQAQEKKGFISDIYEKGKEARDSGTLGKVGVGVAAIGVGVGIYQGIKLLGSKIAGRFGGKKEGSESSKENESGGWMGKLMIGAGLTGLAYYFWPKLKEAASGVLDEGKKEVTKKMIEGTIATACAGVPLIGDKIKDYLMNIYTKHESELVEVDGEGNIKSRYREFLTSEMSEDAKNSIPGAGLVIGAIDQLKGYFVDDDEAEQDEDEKTKEKVEQTAQATDQITENTFDQKRFELQIAEISKQRNLLALDFEKNKSLILTLYTQYYTMLGQINGQRDINNKLRFPNLTKSVAQHVLNATEYMKKNKEYMAATNGIRQIMEVGNVHIEQMPQASSVLSDMNNREKLLASLQTTEDVDQWLSTIYKTKDYQDKYEDHINKRKQKLEIDMKSVPDNKLQDPFLGKLLTNTKNLSDDMFGHGLFTIDDEFYDKYFGVAAGLTGGVLGIIAGTALDLTGIGAAAGVPIQIASAAAISGAVAVLSTKALMVAGGQDYDIFSKQGAGDFILNAVPGGAVAKIGKSAAVVARVGKMGAMGLEGAIYGGAGMAASKIQTGEYNVGTNLAFAMIPLVGSKILAGKNIKVPASITKFSEYISTKYNGSSNKLVQWIRKEQLSAALKGQKGLSTETSQAIQKKVAENGANIGQDINTFAETLSQKEREELSSFLTASGVTENDASLITSLKKAKSNTAPLAASGGRSLENLNQNIGKWTDDEINAFNKYMMSNKSTGLVQWEGKKYYIRIEGVKPHERNIVFTDTNTGAIMIRPGGTEYNQILKAFNSQAYKQIVNHMFEWLKKDQSIQNMTLKELLETNGYKEYGLINRKIGYLLRDKPGMKVDEFMQKYGMDFRNCLTTGDYVSKIGSGLRNASTSTLGLMSIGWMLGDNTAESVTYAGTNMYMGMTKKGNLMKLVVNSMMIYADSATEFSDDKPSS